MMLEICLFLVLMCICLILSQLAYINCLFFLPGESKHHIDFISVEKIQKSEAVNKERSFENDSGDFTDY